MIIVLRVGRKTNLMKYHINDKVKITGGLLISFLESDRIDLEKTEIFQAIDSISGNVITITKSLGSEGLVGLAALGILISLFTLLLILKSSIILQLLLNR